MISEKVARKIEAALGLPPEALDRDAAPEMPARVSNPPQNFDGRRIGGVIVALGAAIDAAGANPDPAKLTRAIEWALKDTEKKGYIDEEFIAHLVEVL
jgi:hypothetical protein